MNLFYTGLGIARSLGSRGIPVVGLTAHREAYGNFSRYVKAIRCAESTDDPEGLLAQMLQLGRTLGHRAVLFPTRDSDLVFLDRYRAELEPFFHLVIPSRVALARTLDKWETHQIAAAAGVRSPRTWLIEGEDDLRTAVRDIPYPCVLKPRAAHHWRTPRNWALVGERKAIGIRSRDQLLTEYAAVAQADARAVVQEVVPGGDDHLIIAACYMDPRLEFQGGFNAQKLVQIPPGFGTGCIVQSVNRPELFDRTVRLLNAMEFSGIAEVEFKWDPRDAEYKLIEVNPRPWDQHRLGAACGVDLIHLAYCDLTGLPKPAVRVSGSGRKWVAEDAFVLALLRLVWRRESGIKELLRQARGRKVYGIWSWRDPLPFMAFAARFVTNLLGTAAAKAVGRRRTSAPAAGQDPAMRATP